MKNKLNQVIELGKFIELTRINVLVWQPEINHHVLGETLAGNVGIVISKSNKVTKQIQITDIVFYGNESGVFIKFNNEKFVLLSEREVLGKISIIDNQTCNPIPYVDDFEIGKTDDWQKYYDELAVKNGALLTGNDLNLQIN